MLQDASQLFHKNFFCDRFIFWGFLNNQNLPNTHKINYLIITTLRSLTDESFDLDFMSPLIDTHSS